jgi:NhaP-type Na+/H+ and K+/H+ antiporter
MRQNKIVLKKMTPHLVASAAFIIIFSRYVVWANVNPDMVKQQHPREENPVLVLNVVFIGLVACLILGSLLPEYNKANKFAGTSARNYLKKIIAEHPEFKEYEYILSDPATMKRIAAVIANELRPSEQKRILKLVRKINLDSSDREIMITHNKIAEIVKEHALFDPGFMALVHAQLINADYVEYVKKIRQINAKSAKEKAK